MPPQYWFTLLVIIGSVLLLWYDRQRHVSAAWGSWTILLVSVVLAGLALLDLVLLLRTISFPPLRAPAPMPDKLTVDLVIGCSLLLWGIAIALSMMNSQDSVRRANRLRLSLACLFTGLVGLIGVLVFTSA